LNDVVKLRILEIDVAGETLAFDGIAVKEDLGGAL